jgi:uncharacterized protein (DUF58 family)
MTRSPTPKLGAYIGLSAAGLIAALAAGRPELVALAAPFVAIVAVGLARAREPKLRAWVTTDRDRLLEGERLRVEVELESSIEIGRLDVLLDLPDGLELLEGQNPVALELGARDRRTLELELSCAHWGGYALGELVLRAHAGLGLVRYEERVDRTQPVKVYPGGEAVRTLLRPSETQLFVGAHVSRTKGDGIEFADLRAFVPGDQARRVNWRASARRGELWVNESHPERSADVVLFLDTFAEARLGRESTIDPAVRATAALATHYLAEKDRVGLVSFGGVLKWLTAASGATQIYRIVDSLLDTEIFLSYAWKELDIIPPRTLPPRALVVALSPLIDERSAHALFDLRRRGFDLAVIEVSPLPFATPGTLDIDRLAYRIWRLRREALRSRYAAVGVPVVEWSEGGSLAAALEEVKAFRRGARIVRA